jgi:hypothetical protein
LGGEERVIDSKCNIFTQLNEYLLEARVDRRVNPVEWWKVNSPRFPCLAMAAKLLLCIPPTSVRSERQFSAAGGIVSSKRNRLSPANVERLLFLKENLPLIKYEY